MPTVDCYCTLPANCNPVTFNVQVVVDNVVKSNDNYECLHNCCGGIQWYCMEPPDGFWYCMRPPASSSSSGGGGGGGSGSGGGTVTVSCCANPIPTTLTMTISSLFNCDCMATEITPLIWNPVSEAWEGSSCVSGNIVQYSLICTVTDFVLNITCQNAALESFVISGTCNPLNLDSGPKLIPDNCCPGGGSVQIIITE